MDATPVPVEFSRDPRYLSNADLAILTGRRNKRDQALQLLKMNIPFALNGIGEPIVPKSVFDVSMAQGRRDVKELEAHFAAVWRRHELEVKLRQKR